MVMLMDGRLAIDWGATKSSKQFSPHKKFPFEKQTVEKQMSTEPPPAESGSMAGLRQSRYPSIEYWMVSYM